MKQDTLKELRIKKKYTQKKAAESLDITKEYLSAMERGKRNPSDKMKIKMAVLYGVTVPEIFLACIETKCFNKVS